jgi:ABC-type antimicrobial peptide transport system permease subunit
MAAEMREAIGSLDPHLAIFGVGSLHQMLGLVYLPMHAAAVALGAFGVLALMLSITGIYGLAAYTVSRRVREIGIRVAIGARPAQVLRLIFARTGVLVAIGAAAGLALGMAGANVLASIVYQASSRDPVVIVRGRAGDLRRRPRGSRRTGPPGAAHRSRASSAARVATCHCWHASFAPDFCTRTRWTT